LLHKESDFLDYFLGTFTLSKALYMHWGVEHLYGHHRNVATPNDPATSKKGKKNIITKKNKFLIIFHSFYKKMFFF
jgi:hypothetical protein